MAIEKIRGIVISVIKHNDKSNIVTLFTENRGRVSFVSATSGSKAGKIRNARLQLMSVIESNVNFKQNQEIQYLGAITPVIVWNGIYFHPVKSAITYFISDFLNKYFREASPDPLAWKFVLSAMNILDKSEQGIANFHLWFLINFLDIAGITPDLSDFSQGDAFDMRAGIPIVFSHIHHDIIPPEQAKYLPLLIRMNSQNFKLFKFSSSERRILISNLLNYYSIHFPGVGNLKSFEILMEIFSD